VNRAISTLIAIVVGAAAALTVAVSPAAAFTAAAPPAAAFTAVASPAPALGDGLALTPPMGFNNWNTTGCAITEDLIVATADLFVSSGLSAAGYRYVNIDDCWAAPDRDAVTGRLVPRPDTFRTASNGSPITSTGRVSSSASMPPPAR